MIKPVWSNSRRMGFAAENPEIVSAGVDWITLVGDTETRINGMVSLASQLVSLAMQRGYQRKGWGMAGYTGFQSLGVQYGVRGPSALVRLSGDVAQLHWTSFVPLSTNCTRVDLQLTVKTTSSPSDVVQSEYRRAKRHSLKLKKGPAVTIVHCTTGGDTCYLGKRQSNVYGRIYDKFAESKDERFKGTVRYEVEYKGHLAKRIVADLDHSKSSTARAVSRVHRFFSDRGCPLPITTPLPTHLGVPRYRSDHARALRWLSEQVRPTVQRLIESGHQLEVVESLGMLEWILSGMGQLDQ